MKKSSEIIGLKLISVTEGKELGVVKELVINPVSRTIAALLIDDGKWYYGAKVLPFKAILGIGEYAVMVESSDNLTAAGSSGEITGLLNAGVSIIGSKILAKSGKILGTATEYNIDDSGKITTCEIELASGKGAVQLANDFIVTYGKDVVIVTDRELA